MACFCCNATENIIFLLKYRQQKADLNTSRKLLVFATIGQKVSCLRPATLYENFHVYAKVRTCREMLFSYILV